MTTLSTINQSATSLDGLGGPASPQTFGASAFSTFPYTDVESLLASAAQQVGEREEQYRQSDRRRPARRLV